MRETLDGAAFREMILCASEALAKNRNIINELNVFPVPDGDTGTNMSLTMAAAATELKSKAPADIGTAAEIVASALLRGARGNSGVILSLLFRGFSKSLKGCTAANAIEFAAELVHGRYKEVTANEFSAAEKAKLKSILEALKAANTPASDSAPIKEPPKEPVTAEVSGIEITDLDDAVAALWQENIYAQSGMGCTGPVVMVNEGKLKQAETILSAKGFIEA